jgi:small subunit ribosomal protein S18
MSDREQSNTEKPPISGSGGEAAPAAPGGPTGVGAPPIPGAGSGTGPSDRPRPPEERRPWRPRERSDDDGREGGGGRFGGGRDRFKDGGRPRFGRFFRRKVCKFCSKKLNLHYRDADTLRRFITERGKILPRRITGTCPKHQRRLAVSIKQARSLALLPFVEK